MEFVLYVLLFVTEGHPTWESIVDTLIIQTVQSFIYLFIHYFKRIAHLATLASLPCGPLDIFTYIQIHTI